MGPGCKIKQEGDWHVGILKRRREASASPVSGQLRGGTSHPFGLLDGYVPLGRGETALYRAIREAIPVVDAALLKIVRLCGGFTAVCPGARETEALGRFLETVPAGRGQFGVGAFLDAYLDSLLTCGRAVGEMVVDADTGRFTAVLCGDASQIEIKENGGPLDMRVAQRGADGVLRELPRQDLLLFTPYHPQPEHPYGVSLLHGMPFLADILLKIFQATGLNWERLGNARFAVVYRPQGDAEQGYAAERAARMAEEWSAAMQPSPAGRVRDFVAVGDVDIRVIGADNPALDSTTPVRQILEQLIARTGIPPFLLGLNWSSTERMSSQQADMMTSELTALRRTVTPALARICRLWLALEGYAPDVAIEWDTINLQDEVQEARAALLRAQARSTEPGGRERSEAARRAPLPEATSGARQG